MKALRHKKAVNRRLDIRESSFFMRVKLLFMLLFLGIAVYIVNNGQTYLEKLDITPISGFALIGNNQFTDYEDVKDKLLKMGTLKGFFGQDIEAVKQQLKTIPWVENVVVRKVWPDRLSIWVTEYTPVAVWNESSAVSKNGVVFQLPANKLKTDNLPILSGPDYQSLTVLDAWENMYNYLKERNIVLHELGIDDRGAWRAVLDNGVVLILGRGEWASKLDILTTIYPQIEVPENKRLSYIDLRYGIGAAVGLVDAD